MNTLPAFTTGTVQCDDCGAEHVAEFHHFGQYDPETPYYEVTCTVDLLAGYYAGFRVTPKQG